ncbi:hypothetical protein [Pseudomonas sp. Z2-11]
MEAPRFESNGRVVEARLTVTESERIHVGKSAFSICNRTLSLRSQLKRFSCRARAFAFVQSLKKDQETPLYV